MMRQWKTNGAACSNCGSTMVVLTGGRDGGGSLAQTQRWMGTSDARDRQSGVGVMRGRRRGSRTWLGGRDGNVRQRGSLDDIGN
jgi:hypothetical protein